MRPARQGKYNARRTPYKERVYASQAEANTAAHLDRLKTLGVVTDWEYEPKFELPGGIVYKADFLVHYAIGRPRVIDVKGVRTAVFNLKVRLMREAYPDVVIELIKTYRELPLEGR